MNAGDESTVSFHCGCRRDHLPYSSGDHPEQCLGRADQVEMTDDQGRADSNGDQGQYNEKSRHDQPPQLPQKSREHGRAHCRAD